MKSEAIYVIVIYFCPKMLARIKAPCQTYARILQNCGSCLLIHNERTTPKYFNIPL